MHITSAVDDTAPGIRAVVDGTVGSTCGFMDLAVTQVGVVPRGQPWAEDSIARVHRVRVESWPPRVFAYAPGLRHAIEHARPDIIHLHGLWQYSSVVVRETRATAVARIVSPHGMLALAALSHHPLRKSIAWACFQRACLVDADVLHATSDAECVAFRDAGFRQPVAIVPPGVNVPDACPSRNLGGGQTALCISRLHPLKGIIDLVHAWSRIRPTGWRLVIAGPDERRHVQEVASEICDRGVGETIVLRGAAWGVERDRLLASADLFVLPSRSENYGLVVAEALAHGVPVLTTRGTPWSVLEREGCGWWVPVGPEGLAAGLHEACRLRRDLLAEKGQRGWNLAQKTFNWNAAASQFAALYRWLVGHGRQPECVRL
jgi:glycosyltransferase involved in cell wall biosynthesis